MYTSHGVVDMHALAFSTQKNSDLTFLTKENMTKHFFTLGHVFFFCFFFGRTHLSSILSVMALNHELMIVIPF